MHRPKWYKVQVQLILPLGGKKRSHEISSSYDISVAPQTDSENMLLLHGQAQLSGITLTNSDYFSRLKFQGLFLCQN